MAAVSCALALASSLIAAPAAPTNLRLVSQTWNSFTFAWNDNASDETSQPIYISEGGQPFYPLSAFRANSTTASLQHLNTNRNYKIYLTAKNASGESAPTNTLVVFIPPPPLTAAFGWTPLNPTSGSDINFVDWSRGSPTSWRWDFGDGTSSTQQHPFKRYEHGATYDVTLTVRSGGESSTVTRSVVVAGGAGGTEELSAAFSCGSCSAERGVSVPFRDQSSGGATSWLWDFGDGSTSTAQNVDHPFAAAGQYAVTLTARRSATTSIATKVVSIRDLPLRLLIPVVARVPGANASSWRTELSLQNSGSSTATLLLTLQSAAGNVGRTLTLNAGRAANYDDVIRQLFDMESGSGALVISSNDPVRPKLALTSRTFAAAESGSTYGQGVGAIEIPTNVLSSIVGIEESSSYRTNIGIVNSGSTAATINLTLRSGDRSWHAVVDAPAGSFAQQPLRSIFPVTELSGGHLRVESSSGDVVAYASIVDNVTQDPTFVAASEAIAQSEWIVPVVGKSPGANGTFWRSDLALSNEESSDAILTFSLIGAGMTRQLILSPGETLTLRDVAAWLGLDGGATALRISATAPRRLTIASRTYTTTATGGTLGQSIAASTATDRRKTQTALHLRDDLACRSNVGIVNLESNAALYSLEARGAEGVLLSRASLQVPPLTLVQQSVRTLFPDLPLDAGSFTVTATRDTAAFIFFASVVDNQSGDPDFIRGQ
jgi:PKD repeat protein